MPVNYESESFRSFSFFEATVSIRDLMIILLIVCLVVSQPYVIDAQLVAKVITHSAIEGTNDQQKLSSKFSRVLNITKRNALPSIRCSATMDCALLLPGSFCVNGSCTCPQGYLPNAEGIIGCFQVGKQLGESCNISAQCGEELSCRYNVCQCPEGFQLFHAQGANLCLLWHRPTQMVDRCRNNEDCLPLDSNSVCRKRWCHCNNGYQLFETMLFGLKHKCFKTYKKLCHNSSHCAKIAESSDQYCICYFGFCHCIAISNSSSLDVYGLWNEKPNWYQRSKKNLILVTRLLFITVILFFVPCFVYVTLGVRQRSRQFFSHVVQPTSRNTVAHVQHSQRRGGSLNSQTRVRGETVISPEAHNVELALSSRGVNSRLVGNRRGGVTLVHMSTHDASLPGEPRHSQSSSDDSCQKEEDAPPSYDEIMRIERIQEAPPPPYQAL